jgi:hypothetical protein
LNEWVVFLETAGSCSIEAAAGAVEMLYTITDGVQYHIPRQWAIDLMVAHRPTEKCYVPGVLE